jgi:hypothetical protein
VCVAERRTEVYGARAVSSPASRSGLPAGRLLHSDRETGKPDQNLSQRRNTQNSISATFTAH